MDRTAPQTDPEAQARVAQLHAQAADDYGTAEARAARATAAAEQTAQARCHGNEAAGAWKGRN